MRLVIQRVSKASVVINNQVYSAIDKGLLVLIGIEERDNETDIDWLCSKIRQMRIFNDQNGKMNLSVEDIQGELLVVSQFTLHAMTAKGNRPSFIKAARPEKAIPLYEEFVQTLKKTSQLKVETGVFAADMQINLVNDGPVTITIDSQNRE